jgi:hypothetical protein
VLVVELGGAYDDGADWSHASAEPPPGSQVYRYWQKASLGPAAQEGPMKTYFFMALAGLIACAIAGMIFLEMTQQISPD